MAMPSAPDSSVYRSLPTSTDDWTCADWQTYYLNCEKQYGSARAAMIVQSDGDRVGWFAKLHLCKYDCNWVKWFTARGMSGGNVFSKLYCGVEDVAGSVGNVAGTANSITSALQKYWPIIAIGAILILGNNGKKRGR